MMVMFSYEYIPRSAANEKFTGDVSAPSYKKQMIPTGNNGNVGSNLAGKPDLSMKYN